SGNHITASLPSDSVKLIPGYYMLFIMVDDIPSVGKILQIKNEFVNEPKEIGFLDSTFVWTEHYITGLFPASWSLKYTMDAHPVLISGKPYYQVLQTDQENSETYTGSGYFIRYENKIVYLTMGQDEVELFNFNLELNDTFTELLSGFDQKLVVDDIDTISLLTGEQRKHWKLRCSWDDPGTDYYTEWVEGIGDINGLFATENFCLIDAVGSDIMCMFRNDTLIYDDPEIDS